MYEQIFHMAISLVALVTMVGGFFVGVRYNTQPRYEPLPIALLVVGIVGIIAGVVGITAAAPYIFGAGIMVGGFLAGLGIGLQVSERTE